MKRMRTTPSSATIGHFDNEIDVASMKQYTWENINRWTTSFCPTVAG